MITIKRCGSNDPLQASQTMLQVKNWIDFSNSCNIPEAPKSLTSRERASVLKKIFIKSKTSSISRIFVDKLSRRLDTDDPIMLKIWQQQQYASPPLQGFTYPQQLEHALDILNIIIIPLLIILASFQGFLDQFNKQYSGQWWILMWKVFCLVVTGLRFGLKCTSVTFCQGQFRKSIRGILQAYFKSGKLVFDLVLIILQLISILWYSSMVISGLLFFYLNLIIIYPGNDTIRTEAAYLQNRKTILIFSLLKILFFNVFFAHFMATIILAMAKLPQASPLEQTWLQRQQIQSQPWHVIYVHAYYWATTIMMTVGFGDILPGMGNWKEMWITSFLEMFSCIVLGYNISTIGNIVSTIRDADQRIDRKIAVFQRMIRKDRRRKVKLNPLLEKRIANYLQQLRINKDNLQYQQRDELLSQLPSTLRCSYYKQANKRLFPSVQFFNQLKPVTLGRLAQKFKSTFYNNGDILSPSGIHILQKGRIGLAYKKKGSLFNGQIMQIVEVKQDADTMLLNGNYFLNFFYEKKYQYVGKGDTIIWSIEDGEFLQVLAESVIDSQYYFSLLHKHMIDENQWEFITCIRCGSKENKRYHSVFNCPKVTYLPLRSMATSFYMKCQSKQQFRLKTFIRERSVLCSQPALIWKSKFTKDYQKVQQSQSYKISSSRRISLNIALSHLSSPLNSIPNLAHSLREQLKWSQTINQQKLKLFLKQILLEHDTNYEQIFWYLQCDRAHDYQFYFPQDNANRFFMTVMYLHPRQYGDENYQKMEMANRLRKIGHLYDRKKE